MRPGIDGRSDAGGVRQPAHAHARAQTEEREDARQAIEPRGGHQPGVEPLPQEHLGQRHPGVHSFGGDADHDALPAQGLGEDAHGAILPHALAARA